MRDDINHTALAGGTHGQRVEIDRVNAPVDDQVADDAEKDRRQRRSKRTMASGIERGSGESRLR